MPGHRLSTKKWRPLALGTAAVTLTLGIFSSPSPAAGLPTEFDAATAFRAATTGRLEVLAHTLEQLVITPKTCALLAPFLDAQVKLLADELARRFTALTGLPVLDAPRPAIWNAYERAAWTNDVKLGGPQRGCELLQLTYALGIARIVAMRPSIDAPPKLLTDEDRARPELSLDRERAGWELRYFRDSDLSRKPPSWIQGCKDLTYAKSDVLTQALSRAKFIQSGTDLPAGGPHVESWPTGRATRMCGRPYTTHYQDGQCCQDSDFLEWFAHLQIGECSTLDQFARGVHNLEQSVLQGQPGR